ncbi:MAG: hypothetical protein ACJA1A_000200 [Saprospiraceae bacterium]|jgi:hypothetical protein
MGIAQYRAIDLSTNVSSFIDDNMDAKFEFRLGEPAQLRQFHLGFSFPLTSHILITPKVGVSKTREQYFNENEFINFSSDYSINTDKKIIYGNVSLESTYWFQQDYKGPFFSGELSTAFILSAVSVSREVTAYSEPYFGNITQNVTADFSEEVQKIMPTIKIGIGYNLDLLTRLNFFAKFNIEYRPTGYYKNTKNISHLSRHIAFGLKYVFGGKTSVVKRFINDYDENNNQ